MEKAEGVEHPRRGVVIGERKMGREEADGERPTSSKRSELPSGQELGDGH